MFLAVVHNVQKNNINGLLVTFSNLLSTPKILNSWTVIKTTPEDYLITQKNIPMENSRAQITW
jgi:hypothetical protein